MPEGWVDGEIVALATAAGHAPVAAAKVPQGYCGYAHARAAGKLLLALVDPSIREAYLAKHPLEQRTNNTIIDREKLEKEFEEIRARGYAVDNEEFYEGLQCLGRARRGSRAGGSCWGSRCRRSDSRRISISTLRRCSTRPGLIIRSSGDIRSLCLLYSEPEVLGQKRNLRSMLRELFLLAYVPAEFAAACPFGMEMLV